MIKPPCLNCEKRHMNCHSKCIDYLTFRKEKEIEYEENRKKMIINSDFYSYKTEKYIKLKKKWR